METTPPTASLTSVVPLGKPASDATLQRPFPVFEKPCGRLCTAWENTFLTSRLRTEQDPHSEPPPPPKRRHRVPQPSTQPRKTTAPGAGPTSPQRQARLAPGWGGAALSAGGAAGRGLWTWRLSQGAQPARARQTCHRAVSGAGEHGNGRGTKRNTGCVPPRMCLIPQTPETNVLRRRADGACGLTPRARAQQSRVLCRLPLR